MNEERHEEIRTYHLLLIEQKLSNQEQLDQMLKTFGIGDLDRYIDSLDQKMKKRSYIAANTPEERKVYTVNLRKLIEGKKNDEPKQRGKGI